MLNTHNNKSHTNNKSNKSYDYNKNNDDDDSVSMPDTINDDE